MSKWEHEIKEREFKGPQGDILTERKAKGKYRKLLDLEKHQLTISKLRPDQLARIEVRKTAKKIWEKDQISIKDMILRPEIVKWSRRSNKVLYNKATIRDWIKDLAPSEKRKPGRPRKES
jgi:hypothetical protein